MPKQKSLHDYDDRYRRVYEAGGLHWNDPHPNPHLADVLEGLTVPTTCIEFGCGEGYQARFMASLGHRVTAVDLSPAAVAKAKRETPPGYQVTYIAGDVTDLCACNLKGTAFDLAVDIGCLHMMNVRLMLPPSGTVHDSRRFFSQSAVICGLVPTAHPFPKL